MSTPLRSLPLATASAAAVAAGLQLSSRVVSRHGGRVTNSQQRRDWHKVRSSLERELELVLALEDVRLQFCCHL